MKCDTVTQLSSSDEVMKWGRQHIMAIFMTTLYEGGTNQQAMQAFWQADGVWWCKRHSSNLLRPGDDMTMLQTEMDRLETGVTDLWERCLDMERRMILSVLETLGSSAPTQVSKLLKEDLLIDRSHWSPG